MRLRPISFKLILVWIIIFKIHRFSVLFSLIIHNRLVWFLFKRIHCTFHYCHVFLFPFVMFIFFIFLVLMIVFDEKILGFFGEAILDMRLPLNFSIQIIWIIKRPAFLWDSACTTLYQRKIWCLINQSILNRKFCQL